MFCGGVEGAQAVEGSSGLSFSPERPVELNECRRHLVVFPFDP